MRGSASALPPDALHHPASPVADVATGSGNLALLPCRKQTARVLLSSPPMHRRAVLSTLALAAAFPAWAAPAPRGRALLMTEAPRCPFCAAFRREVLPIYGSRPEGRAAPLTAVPIDGPWPDGLALAGAPHASPTFILLKDRMELGRFEGYDSPEGFWRALGDLLARG